MNNIKPRLFLRTFTGNEWRQSQRQKVRQLVKNLVAQGVIR